MREPYLGYRYTPYANLDQRDDISIIRGGEEWFDGTVTLARNRGPGAPYIRVDFDDGTNDVRLSFLASSVNYVQPDAYEKL